MMKLSCLSLGLAIAVTTLVSGCTAVTDPETMKPIPAEQAKKNTSEKPPKETAQNQRSTSGRVLAAGSHITGAMFGG
jgi:hypothetical protein